MPESAGVCLANVTSRKVWAADLVVQLFSKSSWVFIETRPLCVTAFRIKMCDKCEGGSLCYRP